MSDPEIARFVAHSEALLPPGYWDLPVAKQRALYDRLCTAFARPRPAGLAVEDFTLAAPAGHEIPLRLYRPAAPPAPPPALLYLHGGGFVLGGLDSHDGIVALLAAESGIAALAVDYRLAPEHPHPAPLEDCWLALNHLAARAGALGLDPRPPAVGGDSGPAIRAQFHIYPALGLAMTEGGPAGEGGAPLLCREEMESFHRAYLGGATVTEDPLAAPLLATDYRGLPPAFVLAAEQDPLAADARLYAERLTAAGVPAELTVGAGLVHGFLRAVEMSAAARAAVDGLVGALKRLHGP